MCIPSKFLLSLTAGTLLMTLAFGSTKAASDRGSSTLYYGGSILTMEGRAPSYAEALVVKDGRILFVGTKTQAEHLASAAARKIDLDGRALLPGFIDAHGHVFNAGFQKLAANLLPPPMVMVRTWHLSWRCSKNGGIKMPPL
ncbi:hypothetical protein [Nitrosococcus watsonii]|uniref:hypothetical protein n=1 Tax=Nitrosococcus watsonii TaxID=473531 RepID=UPI001E3912B7|nr:hypothetical protein [Nitrosococcus watsonii]